MRKGLFYSLLVTGLMTITACGGTGSTDSEGGSNSGAMTSIEFFGWGSAEEQENFQTLVDAFMVDNPNIQVIYNATSSDSYMTTLKNRGSSLPDVFYMPDYEFMQWADSGRLYDMSQDVTQEELDSVWQLSTDMYRYDRSTSTLGTGKLFALPKDLGPYVLAYNKTLLNQIISAKELSIGLPSPDVPMTWNEFRDYLKAIKTQDVFGIGAYEMMHAIYSNNADYWDETVTTQTITSPNFVQAMQFIADLYLVDGVMPSPSQQNSMNAYQRFLNSGSVFAWMGAWDMKAFWNTTDFEFDVIPTPVGPAAGAKSTSWVGSVGYAVSNKSNKKEAAMALAKYLAFNEESAILNYQLGQAMPNVKAIANNEWLDNEGLTDRRLMPANKQLFIDTVNQTATIAGKNRSRYYLYDNAAIDDFEDSLEPLFTGAKTAQQFLTEYANDFQYDLDDNRSYLN
ncbi:MAG: sugar ABC transporter substrate-binding protein [Methanomicrobia archaeon]|nr:sugar ABC transporter substrate-binding protein [Methanomicrobia archaeon]